MARAWRIEYKGALHHVLSRGNEQQDIFRDDQDRNRFLETAGEMSERFQMDIFAYVLMGNRLSPPGENESFKSLKMHAIWKTGLLTNERIGELFGVSYSSISHIVKTVQAKLGTDKVSMEKFVNVYSLFKM